MVLHKWAVVGKTAPPPPGLRPLARTIPSHSRLRPADYKTPYVLRSFIKDRHTSDMQHLENRDGSLNEVEFEFAAPPIVTLFQDRLSAFRQRQVQLAKIGKLRKERSWETRLTGEESLNPVCYATAFPYCVPSKMLIRPKLADPLSAKSHAQGARAHEK